MSLLRRRSDQPTGGRQTLGLARDAIAWRAPDGTLETQTPERFRAGWATRMQSPPRAIDMVVASDLAVHWLQVPPVDVASFRELKLVAAARCAHLHGGSAQDWWVTGDWRAGRPFVCAGLPRDAAESIELLARDARIPVRWQTAWSAATRAAWWPADAWRALRTPGCMTLWHCRAGWVDCLATWAVHPQAPAAELAAQCLAQLQIEMLRDAQLQFGTLHWCDAGAADSLTDLPTGVVRVDIDPIVAVDEAQAALALYTQTERAA